MSIIFSYGNMGCLQAFMIVNKVAIGLKLYYALEIANAGQGR